MPFKLVEPGKRKGNKFYLILGMEAGRQYEVSTRTADKKLAQRRLVELREKLAGAPKAGARLRFSQAAELYRAWRPPSKTESKRVDKVVGALGRDFVADIQHARLVEIDNQLFPHHAAATKNREVLRPAAGILHYAADNGYRGWLRVKLFEEPRPPTRAARPAAIEKLINAVEGRRQLFLIWIYYQGTRITQTLRVTWEEGIDLEAGVFRIRNAKGNRWEEFPLQREVLERLEAIPESERTGRLFSWGDKSNVYRWLRPLVRELKITFTPHMARHTLGTALNAKGDDYGSARA
jgi:integrase